MSETPRGPFCSEAPSSPFGAIGRNTRDYDSLQTPRESHPQDNVSYDPIFGSLAPYGSSASSSLDMSSFWGTTQIPDTNISFTSAVEGSTVRSSATPMRNVPHTFESMDDALHRLSSVIHSMRILSMVEIDRMVFNRGFTNQSFSTDAELRQVFVGQLPASITADRLAVCLGVMTDVINIPCFVTVRTSNNQQAAHALVTIDARKRKSILGLNRRAYITHHYLYFAAAFRDIPEFQRAVSRAINMTTKESLAQLSHSCLVVEKPRRTSGNTDRPSASTVAISPARQNPAHAVSAPIHSNEVVHKYTSRFFETCPAPLPAQSGVLQPCGFVVWIPTADYFGA